MAPEQVAYSVSRRSFFRTLAGVVVIPTIAIAQAQKTVRRIGVLGTGSLLTPEEQRKQAEPWRELGWVEGQNLQVERRYDNGRLEALQSLAEELVRAQVEIIVARGTPATLAAKRATSTIPIVFYALDPVLLGLVANLARPGGNVTGYSFAGPETKTKQLSLLKELLPRLERIGALEEAGNPYFRAARDQFEHICKSLGLKAVSTEVSAAAEIDDAIAQLAQQRVQALMVPGYGFFIDNQVKIVAAATKHGLPIMADDGSMVREAGALIAYSSTLAERERVCAELVDRILRGAKPADLPVRQPTKFELVINLKTARGLGLTIPKELLLRADDLIQ